MGDGAGGCALATAAGKAGPSASGGIEGAPEACVRKVRTEDVWLVERLSGRLMNAEYADEGEGTTMSTA